jgi:UDP-N-acetylglucosamine 2-epimerase (non-hydrolysing)
MLAACEAAMRKVFNVCGARPNFMKIAPLVHAMQRSARLRSTVVHTGQHYSPGLSDVFFEELRIPRPEISLEVGSLPRTEQIALIEERFTPVVAREAPSLIVVVGDVNSTVACARVGRRFGVPVAHVEAGLRSFDLDMPEEHNRMETDGLSDVLYVSEESGMVNLRSEAVPGKAMLVGNVMIDTLIANLDRARRSDVRARLGLEDRKYAVATFHRPSNVDSRDSASRVVDALRLLAGFCPVVFPVHPRTRDSFERFVLLSALAACPGVHLVEPMGYFDFIGLVERSRVVVTDSGGIQEETTYLKVPCLTMRENSERPSTISIGTNLLIGSDLGRLGAELENISSGRFKPGAVPPLWDGKAAERIVADLEAFLS